MGRRGNVSKSRKASKAKARRIAIDRLKELGADRYDLLLPETSSLTRLIGADEEIEGVVYGRYHLTNGRQPGRGLLAATNRRVIFIDHKLLYVSAVEVAYIVISGISRGNSGFVSTITINTRMGDVSIRTFNQHTATTFVHAIESHIFDDPASFRPLHPAHYSS